jgi:mono/diheme cytochrome c family protein
VTRRAAGFAAALALAITAACAKSAPESKPASPAVAFERDPAAVKRGKSLFIGTCGAYCHSMHDGARGDVPDLFDCAWKNGASDEEIFLTISNGVPGTRMVGYQGVLPEGDTDIWKLVAFLRVESTCAKQAP